MVALGFSKDTRMAILLKSIRTERLKDLYAARGASLYAFAKMSIDDSVPNAEDSTQGAAGLIVPGDLPKGGAAPIGVKTDSEDSDSDESNKHNDDKWNPGKNPYSVTIGDRDCDVYLSSENAKININGLNDKNREFLVNFLKKREVEASDADIITDSILDWIDANDLTHINGAEDEYYGSLPDPYKSKDAPFYSIEEMTLVQGVTPEIFENIKDFITVYGDKEISVNVNLASKEILSSIPGLSDNIVDGLSLHIEENGTINDKEELKEIFWELGVIGDNFEDVKRYLTLDNSDFITISAFPNGSGMQKQSNESSTHLRYDYKLIVGKDDNGYKIYAAYPQ
ncbi:putative type II secretion system protein K [Candidatus Brocadiaceae bacterium S225]|uniref:General secretory pathway protein K n=1 Tax=Candidatus Scalindua brodae TaxID=237368 RepID=A0A0B0EKR3_9BACT|nr:MAG: general secretory pathway protein K [Candidatus Scalindua brodae]TWU37982.1 putative type II secretion system protein K [Candidatus Brocadiaceae bacterium S225]